MRKLFYATFFFALIVVSFFVGFWQSQKNTLKPTSPAAKFQGAPENRTCTQTETDTNVSVDTSSLLSSIVKISPEKQQAIGIQFGIVERKPINYTLRILGRIVVDDTRLFVINAATNGWVMDIAPVTPGALVKKGEVLASFYAPELLGAQQSYLYGLNALDRLQERQGTTPGQIDSININITQYRDALRNLGMGDKQIDEIAKTRERAQRIDMCSPAGGIIIFRNIFQGLKFVQGTEFFRIADLSRIWILVDVYENEGKYLKPGGKAKVTLPRQEMTFKAVVSNVLPLFDATTRTLKVRLEADNPGYVLRPDMFVDVEIPVTLPSATTVPIDAVLDSGIKKTIFVDQGNGVFEPREVETGWRIGNRLEIVRGLEPGERIVTSGTFLIDSESKLELAAQGMYTTLSKDPVCGLEVAMRKAERAALKASHGGRTYYFHAEDCRQKFEKEPERYIKK